MIAGRPIAILAGCTLAPEVRAEIEGAGVLVIDIGQRDPALMVRHLRHALIHPMPEPRGSSLIDSGQRSPGLERQGKTSEKPAIVCRVCGDRTEVVAGSGPHAARANCGCGVWRWVSRTEFDRAGIDWSRLECTADEQMTAEEGWR